MLTQGGGKVALAITEPFEDLLEIGDQTRPDLFALNIEKHKPLAATVVGITERLNADGSVRQALGVAAARSALARAKDAGATALAICLMHSYINPAHERELAKIARQVGFLDISVSSETAPLIEIVPRAQTTVLDAYLSPVIREYLGEIASQLAIVQSGDRHELSGNNASPGKLSVMTSAGGLVAWEDYSGKDSILSGPAGGVIALRQLASALSDSGKQDAPIIGLDMGGTSTDVCCVGPELKLEYESTKAGVRVLTPTLPIDTVASGGGSICWCDGVSLRVGPHSAGASPGPAAYGSGGPLTITDVNLFLGLLPAEQFPFPIDHRAVETQLKTVARTIGEAGIAGLDTLDRIARGFRTLACTQMAEAVRGIASREGVDVREASLVGFGGAAGQHVCEVAEHLGVRRIYDTPAAGLMSALGMGLANQQRSVSIPVYPEVADLDRAHLIELVSDQFCSLADELVRGQDACEMGVRLVGRLRYQGTEAAQPLTLASTTIERKRDAGNQAVVAPEVFNGQRLANAFHDQHQQRFGYRRDAAVELTSLHVEVSLQNSYVLPEIVRASCTQAARGLESAGQPNVPSVVGRKELAFGTTLAGPAIVSGNGSTLLVAPNWNAETLSDGTIELSHQDSPGAEFQDGSAKSSGSLEVAQGHDPIIRDCLSQRLMGIATQMGTTLQQTATSVNVKQRRDYSCAVFSGAGELLSSAPHVPVHLGAMGATVRAAVAALSPLQSGDVLVTNDPYRGGSHLPDITVITPVFFSGAPARNGAAPAFFVASRAHHADVGGTSPGSMSPQATQLAEEGVMIPPMFLRRTGVEAHRAVQEHLERAPLPPRDMSELLSDLAAQQCAGEVGAQLLIELAEREGPERLAGYVDSILDASHARATEFLQQEVLDRLPVAIEDQLDDGTPIVVRISAQGTAAIGNSPSANTHKPLRPIIKVDFSGTGPVSPTNFNANPSIVSAALIYVLRVMIGDEISLNEGVLRSIELIVPPGVLNPPVGKSPESTPAVAAGNVETSQRVVDVLLRAFGLAAASQGTMNNLLFGTEAFGFYETICGGAGATASANGASAVHTHMTNTRLTDPEVLEANYPVELTQFRIRRGSGGQGKHNGGDGVERQIRFQKPVKLSLITSRRTSPPPGICGGGAGEVGQNFLIDVSGEAIELPGCCMLDIQPGQEIRVCTPGGGGFGDQSVSEDA
ncbi:MAG TPA: hypothetical protein DDW52_25765 [Planctomycetaceae bacterium]|nr:hypothetical protein [Planctomycetaceae bacterium]